MREGGGEDTCLVCVKIHPRASCMSFLVQGTTTTASIPAQLVYGTVAIAPGLRRFNVVRWGDRCVTAVP